MKRKEKEVCKALWKRRGQQECKYCCRYCVNDLLSTSIIFCAGVKTSLTLEHWPRLWRYFTKHQHTRLWCIHSKSRTTSFTPQEVVSHSDWVLFPFVTCWRHRCVHSIPIYFHSFLSLVKVLSVITEKLHRIYVLDLLYRKCANKPKVFYVYRFFFFLYGVNIFTWVPSDCQWSPNTSTVFIVFN